jgi:uncharacterized Zn finger protein (UPF0148 family)
MLYQICPKCHFRLQATKHICSTCGHVLQNKKSEAVASVDAPAEQSQQAGEEKSTRSFWKSLFGTT